LHYKGSIAEIDLQLNV